MDTGSTDRSKEIAQENGAEVYDFAWSGDFSQARNFSLSKATEEWILVIDPDERIAPNDCEKILSLSKKFPNADAFHFETRNYTEKVETAGFVPCQREYPDLENDLPGYFVVRRVRLFKNKEGIHYKGKLHESILHCFDHPTDAHIPVHHYGHLNSEYRRKDKAKLYLQTAIEKTESSAFDSEAWYQLGLEWVRQENYEKAEKCFRHAHHLKPLAQTYSQLGASLIQNNKLEEAIEILSEGLQRYEKDHDLFQNYSTALINENRSLEAFAVLQKATDLFPKSFSLFRQIGFVSMKLNDSKNARHYLEKSYALCPHYMETLVDMAMLDFHEQKQEAALKKVETVLKAHPNHQRALALKSQLPF